MGHTSSITMSYSNSARSGTSGKPYMVFTIIANKSTDTIQLWTKGMESLGNGKYVIYQMMK